MDCLICRELERVLESRHSEYIEARSAAYYQVTTEFAAHKNVDKERAKSDLEEHQLVCVSAARMRQSLLLGGLDGERHAGKWYTTNAQARTKAQARRETTTSQSGRLPRSPH